MMSKRIMIVDDHAIFRDGIKALINEIDGYSVIADAENGKRALDILDSLAVDIIFTDLKMPLLDGVELCKKVSTDYPSVDLIVLTMFINNQLVDDVKNANARAYITKTVNKERLVEILSEIGAGSESFILETKEDEYIGQLQSKTLASKLTKRELEILVLIASGLTDKSIAEELFLSHSTIISHRKNMLTKLKLSNKADLTRFAIENGIYI